MRISDGRTPVEVAALAGCPDVVDWLVGAGADPPPDDGVDALIAALVTADRNRVDALRRHLPAAWAERPALVVWAAARGKLDAVVLLAECGFDVSALGRTDVPMEQAWETALHHGAAQGDVDMVRTLLELGADPTIKDARFNGTPLDWAQHFDQPATAALLAPVTPAP
jgi:hypothetical protein